MLSCVFKRISGLIFERVFRELRYLANFVCTGCKFFYNCNTRTTQRNYKSCMPTANYEDCPRCVGQACQTYTKYAS